MTYIPGKVQLNKQGEPWCPDCGRIFTDLDAKVEVERQNPKLTGAAPLPPYCETCGAEPKAPPKKKR